MRALTIEEIRIRVYDINKNIRVESLRRHKGKTKLICRCLLDNHEWETTMGNLEKLQGCPKCSGNAKFTKQDILDKLKENCNIDVLDFEYKNANSKINLKCKVCNCDWSCSSRSIINNKTGCPNCANKNRNLNRIKTFEEIKYHVSLINSDILLYDLDRNLKVRVHTPLKAKCNICSHEWSISYNNIRKGRCCPKCAIKSKSGENNCNYNPNLTDEEREFGRNIIIDGVNVYAKWRSEVYEKYNYTCAMSGIKGDIVAHHLNGYHWDKENRHNVDNGICISTSIHKLFHKIYGIKNNTKEQFEEFLIRYKNNEF